MTLYQSVIHVYEYTPTVRLHPSAIEGTSSVILKQMDLLNALQEIEQH